MSRQFDPSNDGGAWLGIMALKSDDATNSYSPVISMNDAGIAMVLWRQDSSPNTRAWSRRYTPTGGWATATEIGNVDVGPAYAANVSIAGSGESAAQWNVRDGGDSYHFVARHDGSNWSTPTILSSPGAFALGMETVFDNIGTATAIWTERVGLVERIMYSRQPAGEAWYAAQAMPMSLSSHNRWPEAVSLPSGDVIATWRQLDGGATSIVSSRYSGGIWSWPESVIGSADGTLIVETLSLAAAPNGNALAVWNVWNTSDNTSTIWGRQYLSSGNQWSAVSYSVMTGEWTSLKYSGDGYAYCVAVNAAENVDAMSKVLVARFDPAGNFGDGAWAGWDADAGVWNGGASPVNAEIGSAYDGPVVAYLPSLATDGDGNVVVVWIQATDAGSAKHNVWAAHYR
jgi:hypothetical protein